VEKGERVIESREEWPSAVGDEIQTSFNPQQLKSWSFPLKGEDP
jgi:hypothetical protein